MKDIYFVIGEKYGMTSVYWPTQEEAEKYMETLQKIYNDNWRVVTLSPAI